MKVLFAAVFTASIVLSPAAAFAEVDHAALAGKIKSDCTSEIAKLIGSLNVPDMPPLTTDEVSNGVERQIAEVRDEDLKAMIDGEPAPTGVASRDALVKVVACAMRVRLASLN